MTTRSGTSMAASACMGTMSKGSHGMYLSHSAAGREPMAFAAYGDYLPRPPQENYNMADLGAHGNGCCGHGRGGARVQPCCTAIHRAWNTVSARGMSMDSTTRQRWLLCASTSGARCIPNAGPVDSTEIHACSQTQSRTVAGQRPGQQWQSKNSVCRHGRAGTCYVTMWILNV